MSLFHVAADHISCHGIGVFVLELWQIALTLLRQRSTFTILERQHADPSTLILAAYH